MKQIRYSRFGPPSRVAECVDVPEPGEPSAWEVAVDVAATCINPSDISMLRGQYGTLPSRFPATLGLEASGVVTACGASVSGFEPGDKVIVVANDNWVQRRNVAATVLFKAPDDMDLPQLAMVKVNSLCAHIMLERITELEPGDFIIQSAPLSAVGRMVIGFAKARGVKTINIVRRDEAIAEVKALGGDVTFLDGEDLAPRVLEAVAGGSVRLALDAVAGDLSVRLADCLDEGGIVLNYGMLSGQPCQLRPDQTIFKNIRLQGFWLSKLLFRMTQSDRTAAISETLEIMRRHGLENGVARTFPLRDIATALDFAESAERRGKVMLYPNGEPGV
ncbi:MAG: zinc-dependent alcohol dehydrogenase family protein [Pseudomonadota bacterium]